MNYIEMYIKNVDEKDSVPAQTGKLYLLPGLADVHTSAISDEKLAECKKEYNRYLEMFKSKGVAVTKQDEENMLFWLKEMHALLYKIGRYTHQELTEGFTL